MIDALDFSAHQAWPARQGKPNLQMRQEVGKNGDRACRSGRVIVRDQERVGLSNCSGSSGRGEGWGEQTNLEESGSSHLSVIGS